MVDRRNFRKNPVTTEELVHCYWFAVQDDLIGGFSVATVNKPESQIDVWAEEFTVGTFMTLATAQHIADVHNFWWQQQVWQTYSDNVRAAFLRKTLDEGDNWW
jgi:hypothetical protein